MIYYTSKHYFVETLIRGAGEEPNGQRLPKKKWRVVPITNKETTHIAHAHINHSAILRKRDFALERAGSLQNGNRESLRAKSSTVSRLL